jgi:pectate lyase
MIRPTASRIPTLGITLVLSAAACSGGTEQTTGEVASGGTTATGPAAGMAAVGGTVSTAETVAAGGRVATMNTNAGASAGGAPPPTATGSATAPGDVPAESGSGGSAGASGMTAADAGAPSGGTGGEPPTAGRSAPSDGPCKPIGWATRDGRTGGEVAVTGGGDAMPVVVTSFAALQSAAQDSQPRVIHIDGAVGAGWRGTSGDRLEVGSNKTIVGLRPDTQLKAAIHVGNASNVIIRNLVIRGPGSNDDQAWDNLNIDGSSKNIWIDHCEFWDGQDGNADVVKGADNVTFTWNIFGYRTGGDHNFSNLVASSDDEPQSEGKLNITLMFNWFTGVAQRAPRCRYGDIHVVNNLFSRDGQKSDYGISAGKNCRILTEANHFIEINTPISMSHASGSAANELRGDNIFERTTGDNQGYGKAFEPPYEYKQLLVKASEVKALVEQKVGAKLENPSACD